MTSAVRLPDRAHPMPLWAQVLDDLRRRLDAGEFASGFPPERELIDQYGVSRHTVRDAMTRLREAGVISRERGRGTFVRPRTIEQSTGVLYSLFRSIETQGFEQQSTVLHLELVTSADVAARLGLGPHDALVYLHRVRCADDEPIAVDEVWLPARLAAPLLHADFHRTSLYEELERACHLRPEAGHERVSPILPSPAERRALGLAPDQPAFLIERFTKCERGPLEWRRTVIRGDRYAFASAWGPEAGHDDAAATTSIVPTAP